MALLGECLLLNILLGKQYTLLLNQPNAQCHENTNRRDSTSTCFGRNIPYLGITVYHG